MNTVVENFDWLAFVLIKRSNHCHCWQNTTQVQTALIGGLRNDRYRNGKAQ
jgi:hypothetical protein